MITLSFSSGLKWVENNIVWGIPLIILILLVCFDRRSQAVHLWGHSPWHRPFQDRSGTYTGQRRGWMHHFRIFPDPFPGS